MISGQGFDQAHSSQTTAEITGDTAENPMQANAASAAEFLKALSHEARLMILCHLSDRELSVTELEGLLGTRQSAVSQHLARLRADGLVASRREGKAIFYRILDPRARAIVAEVYRLFCAPKV